MKKRLPEMDILRGFCMLSVLILHTLRYAKELEPIFHYVSAFCVVSFFFVSGYFFSVKEEHVTVYIKKKAKQLLIPYAISGVISIFLYQFFLCPDYPFSQGIRALLIGNGANSDALIFNPPLWFLPAIFSMTMVSYLIHRGLIEAGKKRKLPDRIVTGTWLLPVLLATGYYFSDKLTDSQTFFGLQYYLGTGVFFELGYQIKLHNLPLKPDHMKRPWLVAFGIFFLVTAFYADSLNIRTSCMNLRYGDYTLFLITGFLATYGLYLISCSIRSMKTIEIIGKNTIDILIIHKLFIVFYRNVWDLDAVITGSFPAMVQFMVYLLICFTLCFISIQTVKAFRKITEKIRTEMETWILQNSMGNIQGIFQKCSVLPLIQAIFLYTKILH